MSRREVLKIINHQEKKRGEQEFPPLQEATTLKTDEQ